MELYLVQHGEAKSKAEDPQRPLTERGRDEVQQVAEFAAKAGLEVSQIRHSGKRRGDGVHPGGTPVTRRGGVGRPRAGPHG